MAGEGDDAQAVDDTGVSDGSDSSGGLDGDTNVQANMDAVHDAFYPPGDAVAALHTLQDQPPPGMGGGLIGSLLSLVGANPSDPGNQRLMAGVLGGAGNAVLGALSQSRQQQDRVDMLHQQSQANLDQLNAQNAFIAAREAVPAFVPGKSLTMSDFGLMRGGK